MSSGEAKNLFKFFTIFFFIDFGNHPLSHLMKNVFGYHNKGSFEIYCYALSPSDRSVWRRGIEEDCDVFRDVSDWKCDEVAKRIINDQIHVLVNLNGYTKGAKNEIFALRPAPIQISLMGFCGTMGADFVDYIVGDEVSIPPHMSPHFSESIIRLPNSYFVTDHRQSARYVLDHEDRPTRGDYNIPEDAFVFANFSQNYKFSPNLISSWVKILKNVRNSILWLLKFPPEGEDNLKAEV